MLQLKCTGLSLTALNTLSCAEGSIDVPVNIEFDSTYNGYTKSLSVGYYDEKGMEQDIEVPQENEQFTIPGPVFAQSGIIFISVHFKKDGTKFEPETNAVNYYVTKTARGSGNLGAKYTWEPVVKSFVDQYLTNNPPTVVTDPTLTKSGQAADAKVVGDKIKQLNESITNGSGITEEHSNTLWALIQKMAFTEQVTDEELNAFKTTWGITDTESGGDSGSEEDIPTTPTVTLSSIEATYSGGDVTVGTELTDLVDNIVVTAKYSDGTSQTVIGYELSGSIVEGSNIITVTYQGKTTTFVVVGIVESGGDEPLYTFESVENVEVASLQNVQMGALTVSNGNHIKFVNTNLNAEYSKWFFNMNVSSLATNGVTTPTETWFTIPSGANVKLCVKNLNANDGVSGARLGLNSHENVHTPWYIVGDTLGDKTEFTFTTDSDKDIKCVYLDLLPILNTPFSIELDVELYVNDERLI